MTAPAAIRLQGVHKVYPGRVPVSALTEVSLTVEPGAFLAVEGPSGSGKTTLLSLVGGLDRPTRGLISVFGMEVGGLDERGLARYRRDHVGFVFQDFKLLDALSAAENVAVPLRLRGVRSGEALDRARRALAEIGLDARVHARPRDLSGGEQQRVAIARAAVTGAPLLLADEPTAHLDGPTGAHVLRLLRGLSRARGATVVVVSHDLRVASEADATLRLLDGRRVDVGGAEVMT